MEDANNAPFEYLDENAQLTGFHVEIVRAVAERLGWRVIFRRYPWKRAMRALEEAEVDAVTYMAYSYERSQFAVFLPDNLLHISDTLLYIRTSRAEEIQYQPPLDRMVRQWRTAVPNGYYMSDSISGLLAEGAPIERPTVTQSQLFDMLLSDRYDAVFGAAIARNRAGSGIEGLHHQVQPLKGARFAGKQMYIAFARPDALTAYEEDSRKAAVFAQAYRRFREEPAYGLLAERFDIVALGHLPRTERFSQLPTAAND
ncbi:substrate-binding periplasmic protein [Marinobacter fonticola]|uniref:substrate-binding periplasmic protein n=1 Tax=Marinobacter fonticola TaxID=2603215 RepID=UPI0019310E41|nr:transporter substrate-binding domain-containing protein [Marinobacter fonticola]